MPYLPFVDVRSGGLNSESLITARIPHVTMNWPSPLVIDPEQNRERKITELMHSSKKSWATASSNVQPDFEINGQLGFGVDGEVKPYLLAAVVEGRFESAFKGKDSPLLKPKEEKEEEKEAEQAPMSEEPEKKEAEPTITGVIEKSAESARLVVFTSNEFLTDQVLQISAMSGTMRYMNTLQVVENVVDWSLEDPALLTIRSRGHFTSTLDPMSSAQKSFWEYFNYAAALLGLLLVYLLYRARRARTVVRYNSLLAA